jgi:hypothetical protein
MRTLCVYIRTLLVCKYLGPSSDVIGSCGYYTIELSCSQFFICVAVGKTKTVATERESCG